ncbi:hypothetical protein A3B35_00145 [Candidatus Kaiserbacteria bacterium RIFCSPLOWO2_01_FULL_54_24]|uniref:Pesticidal crystal protein Cry22Aa Ig-like domain-containing protein n=1 Tax=Candidatus Kaiserbacteria bacterium RIFCSPLOWO2_01_FULL_54_24 TaxID=1798515 RepID=A0A1F6ESL2_9BACT|nr:MAG: hypothetical protein A3B35_00145 [Candidatus Kaiserbacteria bacterium RIFCSPLOWO2_01_FULL_54_24]
MGNASTTQIGSTGSAYFATIAGNVGIGETAPGSKLSVSGGGSFGSGYDTTAAPTGGLIIEGNVGIGMTTPTRRLSIAEGTASTNDAFMSFNNNAERWTIGNNGVGVGGASGNAFVIYGGTTPNYRFVVDSVGNVGIGTTTPVSTLSVQGSLCVRDTGSCGTTAGTIYATTVAITDIDLAENYPAFDGSLVAGEIVALEGTQPSTIKRAVRGETPLGIISTKPGLTLGKEIANSKPVALSGRVPLKVNNEGGSIKIGDHIMLSSVPGVGMAATTSAQTVGIALSAAEFATSTTATIEVFVQSEFTLIQTDRSLLAALGEITSSTVQTLSGSAGDFFTGLTARLAAWLGNAGNGILDLFATRIHAETVYAKELCLGDTCVNEEQLKALLNGSLTSVNTSTSTNMGTSGVQGTSDVQAPTVTLNGNNPATVAVGAAYSDLGAIIADDVDQNLGYTVALDGGTAMDISTLSLDTSVGGTHYIVYSAADQAGNTGTATRTVIVGDGLPAAGVAGDTASSTPSGTSSQQADNFGTGATSATSSPDTVSTTGNLGTGATTTTP